MGDEVLASPGAWPAPRVLERLLAERRWDDARRWAAAAAAASSAANGGSAGPGGAGAETAASALWRVTLAQADAIAEDAAELDWLTEEERLASWDACDALFLSQGAATLPAEAGSFFLRRMDEATARGAAAEAAALAALALRWGNGTATRGAAVWPASLLEPLELRMELLAARGRAEDASEPRGASLDADAEAVLTLLREGREEAARSAVQLFKMAPPLAFEAAEAAAAAAALPPGQRAPPASVLSPGLLSALARGGFPDPGALDSEGLIRALGAVCPPGGGRAACRRVAATLEASAHLDVPYAVATGWRPLDTLQKVCGSFDSFVSHTRGGFPRRAAVSRAADRALNASAFALHESAAHDEPEARRGGHRVPLRLGPRPALRLGGRNAVRSLHEGPPRLPAAARGGGALAGGWRKRRRRRRRVCDGV